MLQQILENYSTFPKTQKDYFIIFYIILYIEVLMVLVTGISKKFKKNFIAIDLLAFKLIKSNA
jgi:hypothetical protein